jgi:hypothetical protein
LVFKNVVCFFLLSPLFEENFMERGAGDQKKEEEIMVTQEG